MIPRRLIGNSIPRAASPGQAPIRTCLGHRVILARTFCRRCREYLLQISDRVSDSRRIRSGNSRNRSKIGNHSVHLVCERGSPELSSHPNTGSMSNITANTDDHQPRAILRRAIVYCVYRDPLNHVAMASISQCLLQLNEGRLLGGGEPMVHADYVLDHDHLRVRLADKLQEFPRQLVADVFWITTTCERKALARWPSYDRIQPFGNARHR